MVLIRLPAAEPVLDPKDDDSMLDLSCVAFLAFRRLICAGALFAVATAALAAQPYGPMRLEKFQPCLGNASFCAATILATGLIQPDSAEKLAKLIVREGPANTVVFDSPGGSLLGGIELGRLIRTLKLDTLLATQYTEEEFDKTSVDGFRVRVLAKDAICASACSLAYLGGFRRTIDDGGMLGVHQFSSARGIGTESTSQVVMTAIAAYISEMGVDRRLLDLASLTAADDMYWIKPSEARLLNVVSSQFSLNEWEVSVEKDGTPTVLVRQQRSSGHSVSLVLQANARGDIRMSVVSFFLRASMQNPRRLLDFPVKESPDIRLIVNGQELRLRSDDQWSTSIDSEKGTAAFVMTTFLTQSDVETLRQAKTLRVGDSFPNSILDLSVGVELSAKNLAGGIGLLLRSSR